MSKIKSIGIIGHGRFGSLFAVLLKKIFPVAEIKIFSRSVKPDLERFFSLSEACASALVIPVVPIHSFEEVIGSISKMVHKDACVMDVCSVKEYPVRVMKSNFSTSVSIIASHPLFGPGTLEKQNGEFRNLKIVLSKITGDPDKYNEVKSAFISNTFEVIEMSPREHDLQMAKSQFIVHLTAGVLHKIGFKETPADTRTASVLHNFMEMIQPDLSLLQDMFTYNPYCKSELEKFSKANNQINNLLSK